MMNGEIACDVRRFLLAVTVGFSEPHDVWFLRGVVDDVLEDIFSASESSAVEVP